MSIRWRLTLWYTCALGLTLFIFGAGLYAFMSHMLTREVDEELAARASVVVRSITVVGHYPFPLQQIVLPEMNAFSSPDTYLQVISREGKVVTRSNNLGNRTLPLSSRILNLTANQSLQSPSSSTYKAFYETVTSNGQKLRIYNLPLLSQNRVVGILQVGRSLASTEAALNRLRFLLTAGGGIAVLAAGLVGWLFARAALRPIEYINQTAAIIQKTRDLEQRIPYKGPADELGTLIKTLNNMLARLNTAYKKMEEAHNAQRRFVADASHQLRTPLTIIRGNVELLQKMGDNDPETRREALEDISVETKKMSALITNLLALARADAGLKLDKHPLWLHDLLNEVQQRCNIISGDVKFSASGLSAIKNVQIKGNYDYLTQLLMILLDNAFKYTPGGGKVFLKVSVSDQQVSVSISDTGPGIPKSEQTRIFDRFYRARNVTKSKGTGLGLAIAKWIADEHGGRIEVQSEPGRGSTFTVCLPRWSSPFNNNI